MKPFSHLYLTHLHKAIILVYNYLLRPLSYQHGKVWSERPDNHILVYIFQLPEYISDLHTQLGGGAGRPEFAIEVTEQTETTKQKHLG